MINIFNGTSSFANNMGQFLKTMQKHLYNSFPCEVSGTETIFTDRQTLVKYFADSCKLSSLFYKFHFLASYFVHLQIMTMKFSMLMCYGD